MGYGLHGGAELCNGNIDLFCLFMHFHVLRIYISLCVAFLVHFCVLFVTRVPQAVRPVC